MDFSIICATDSKNGIGKKDSEKFYIPWKSSVDMKFFKDITTNTISKNKQNAIIMGRNTFSSLPKRGDTKKLSNRHNFVITSNPESLEEEVTNFNSLTKCLEYCSLQSNIDKIFVIGGAQLYKEAIYNPNLKYCYLNIILDSEVSCNINFPVDINSLTHLELDQNYEMNSYSTDKILFKRYISNFKNEDEKMYLQILGNILKNGDERQTRNSITKSIFGERLEFDLKEGFPLLTTKKMFLRGIFEELIWFFKGCTDSKVLEEKNVNIWKWNSTKEFIDSVNLPYREGDIGNMYGFQWKHAGAEYRGCDENYDGKGFNQIDYCLNLLKTDKYSRRILMTTYVPHEASNGVLYPCHGLTVQWYVKEYDGINYLSCHMYQRSADMFLGVPFNISSYALMCNMFCEVLNNDSSYTGMPFRPDKLIMSFGDLHIYESHYEQVSTQLSRQPFRFPKIKFNRKVDNLESFKWEDINITNYNHHKGIKASMVA